MTYKTEGVCCQEIKIEIANGIITDIDFVNGCDGNLKGIAQLAKGRRPEDVIASVSGIRCRNRPTSCPDQLAMALRAMR